MSTTQNTYKNIKYYIAYHRILYIEASKTCTPPLSCFCFSLPLCFLYFAYTRLLFCAITPVECAHSYILCKQTIKQSNIKKLINNIS